MEKQMKFRHELKYVVSSAQVELIKNRVEHLLPRDPHAGEKGRYAIRSLYFDDYENRCYRENEEGTDPREKFRIRIYNHSAEKIRLECKRKERGMTHKESCPLTQARSDVWWMLKGTTIPLRLGFLPVLASRASSVIRRSIFFVAPPKVR